jgi:BlaI family penicillinase repressor
MPGKPKPRKNLSELESQLMDILWKSGPSTAEQVREQLAHTHELKDSTIRTVLGRLREKGYVKHRQEGKAYIYSVVEKPANVAVRAVRQIIDKFCEGSLEQLLVGLVENEVVDAAELQLLAKKISKGEK